MTTDRNSEGAVRIEGSYQNMDGSFGHLFHSRTHYADGTAFIQAAEVLALVERWRALAASLHPDDPRSYSHALGVTGCADELAKLIPRGNTK